MEGKPKKKPKNQVKIKNEIAEEGHQSEHRFSAKDNLVAEQRQEEVSKVETEQLREVKEKPQHDTRQKQCSGIGKNINKTMQENLKNGFDGKIAR